MKTLHEIKKELNITNPIFGYNPIGIADPKLAVEISRLGGVGLMNLIGLKEEEAIKALMKLKKDLKNEELWGVRISSHSQLEWLINNELTIPLVILPFTPTEKQLGLIKKRSQWIVAEVLYLDDAKNKTAWADFFLVKGNEAGGIIGTKASFIQIQEFYEAGFPFIIQGGIGVYNIASALIGGALGVVMEGQLYQLEDCPLPLEQKEQLASLAENDTYIVLESKEFSYRLAGKLANKTIRKIKEWEVEQIDSKDVPETLLILEEQEKDNIGFKNQDIKHAFLPLGLDLCFSSYIKGRFQDLRSFVKGILELISEQLYLAQEKWPFDEKSTFAKEIGTKYPFIQGPMANVSDNVEFAIEVAKSGALPVLALGGLMKDETEELFDKVKKSSLPEYPYGCGIIGLEAVKKRREEHLELLKELRPKFVLIAAGTVNLGLKVKEMGFDILLHTPALAMFKDAINNNVRYPILEGNECGGHMGVLSSFFLWERVLEYLDTVRVKLKNKKINLIFAGGIGDEIGTAMLATMISTHLDLISPAIQMGSAYLLTEEIVESKALTELYQEFLLNENKTRVIGATVNARVRAVKTPFIERTIRNELKRIKEGISLNERKVLYEKDNLGALRIASKAEIWNNDHIPGTGTTQFVKVNKEKQKELGCFMAGEIVSRKRNLYTLSDLHYDLSQNGVKFLAKQSREVKAENFDIKANVTNLTEITEEFSDENIVIDTNGKIAIVGMGCVLPDSPDIDSLWKNILSKRYSITEIPHERWDPRYYYDEDRSAPEKTYTKIGAFVKGITFKSIKYKIPPRIAEHMDDVQKWALIAAEQALQDAGLPTNGKKRLPVAVIIGNSLGGENQRLTNRRLYYSEIKAKIEESNVFKKLTEAEQKKFFEDFEKNYFSKFPHITEDTMPGELSNVISGRIANVFNLSGKSMSTDAACASSLAAIDTAMKGLLNHDFDIALAGGADRSMDVSSYVKFCKIGALSAIGSMPFDKDADGFVMGEGVGLVVLKRLDDALRENDKIYAIIDAIGTSSDGKGKGITAPNPIGQKEAIERALKEANVTPDHIDLIEAHGTSTKVGDQVEIQVLDQVFSKRENKEKKIALGSIKSQIGHLKSAAGIASLLKASLALYHKTIPPTVNVKVLNPVIDWNKSALEVVTEARPWDSPRGHIRRAGVSAFGFGGANYHAILEEYVPTATYQNFSKIKESKKNISEKIEERLAYLFTGQGSQYLGMIGELYQKHDVVRKTIDEADTLCIDMGHFSLKEVLFGSSTRTKEENEAILKETQYTQPALYVVEIALYRLFFQENIHPGKVAGHSLGEYSALVAAGVLSFEDGLKAVIERGRLMSIAGKSTPGAMAAVIAETEIVEDLVKKVENSYVIIANYNSTNQTVVSGEIEGIEQVIKLCEKQGIRAIRLNVSTAFHSRIVQEAEKEMAKTLEELTFKKSKIPVYSNTTGEKYPSNAEKIRALLIRQLSSPVQWVREIHSMYEDGARIFVEIGPKKALFNFVKDILKDKKDVVAFNTLNPKIGEEKNILKVVSKLKEIIDEQRKTLAAELSQTAQQPIVKTQIVTKESSLDVLTENPEIKILIEEPYFKEYLKENSEMFASLMKQGYEIYNKKYRKALEIADKAEKWEVNLDPIGITGVGIGAPGKSKAFFSDDNFELILNGVNLIDSVDEAIKEEMLNKNIVKLVKSPDGTATFESIDDISNVIQLAGQLGKLNAEEDFGIDKKLLKALDSTFIMAIGAGFEALRDAGIPLVQSEILTSTGKILKGQWVLPKELQEDTGIIFASAFPAYDNLIEEGTRHIVHNLKRKSREEKKELFNKLISTISNEKAKEEIKLWLENNSDLLNGEEEEDLKFSREFIYKVLSMGHSQFAQLIKAKGPNTQVNSACASTTLAIGIAEDWIRRGRCKRVIVIAADNASSPNVLPWIGGGFLAAGGVTTKDKVEEAALPFGTNRHGLIISAAAAGIVVESQESYQHRGVKPLVDLLGTDFANSAYHGSRLDVDHIAMKLEEFIERVEKRYNIPRSEIAKQGMFVSHETYTPARGGSAEAEIKSIERVFKNNAYDMTIINTKGFTGHAMGAGIEEAVAIKAMEKGKLPPIANSDKIDPAFSMFKFSKGEKIRLKYALRLAAGFGSQLAFALFKLNSYTHRFDSPVYVKWLESIEGRKDGLYVDGRVLKVRKAEKKEYSSIKPTEQELNVAKPRTVEPVREIAATSASSDLSSVLKEVVAIISDKTGYEPEVIEANMHLEEDLGIDSIKAAEIMSDIGDKWNIPQEQLMELVDLDTPNKIAKFIADKKGIKGSITAANVSGSNASKLEQNKEELQKAEGYSLREHKAVSSSVTASERSITAVADSTVVNRVKEIIAKHTGYDLVDLDENYDLEEDLGIDTVKQAEIFGDVRDEFGLNLDESFSLAEFRTINDIITAVSRAKGHITTIGEATSKESISVKANEEYHRGSVAPISPTKQQSEPPSEEKEEILSKVISLISKVTGYDTEDIDPKMDLEEDLGVDSIKTAEIFSEIRDLFTIDFDEMTELSEIRTAEDIANYVIEGKKQQVRHETVTQIQFKEDEKKTQTIALELKEQNKIIIRKLVPIEAALNEEKVTTLPLNTATILLINMGSPLAAELSSDLEELAHNNVKTVEILKNNGEFELSTPINSSKNYDLILILLPTASSIDDDLVYYEKLFQIFQPLPCDKETKIVAVSPEPFFGYSNDSSPLSGGVSGFIKTIMQEFECQVKHVYSSNSDEIIEEMVSWDTHTEISYSDSKRYALSYSLVDEQLLNNPQLLITDDDLIFVTGGARGITYASINRLIENISSSPSIAIVGRTTLPEDITELIYLSAEEIEKKKSELKVKLEQENEKVTPVMIERAWQKFLNTIEISRNIMTMIDNGLDVNYYSADITNEEALREVITQIEDDFGKTITIVVHGAGIEESKAFKKKKLEKSKLIVDVKIRGIRNILQFIDKTKLKRIVCFSSIAGRFGNRGQIDYAYANGYLSRLCWKLEQEGIPALAIDWSAWAEIGMATKGTIANVLRSAGITLIPPERGTELFSKLLMSSMNSEVIVAGKLGLLLKEEEKEVKEKQVEKNERIEETSEEVKEEVKEEVIGYPMIQAISESEEKVVGYKVLTTKNDLYMLDHQIQGVPIFPAVMGIESFAELYYLEEGQKPSTIEDISFDLAIKQFKQKDLDLIIEYNKNERTMKIKSLFKANTPNAKEQERLHFKSRFPEEQKIPRKIEKRKIKPNPIELLNKEEIYSIFFHGKSFQVLESLDDIRGNNIITRINLPEEPIFADEEDETIVDPRAIEAALQTAGLYDLCINSKLTLPSKIKAITFYKEGKPVYAEATFLKIEDKHSIYDVKIIGEKGEILIELKELGMIFTNVPLTIPEEISRTLFQIREYHRIFSSFNELNIKIVPISRVKKEIEQNDAKLRQWLVGYEKVRYNKITNEKRKTEYLAGIIAAKIMYASIELLDEYTDIEIKKTPKGQPYFYNRITKEKSNWKLSISHSHDFAIAAVSEQPIGVDIEKIEERKESFYREAFTPKEQQNITNDMKKGTTYWTAKEAVSKALGEGLNVNLKDIEITEEKEGKLIANIKDKTTKINEKVIHVKNSVTDHYSVSMAKLDQKRRRRE